MTVNAGPKIPTTNLALFFDMTNSKRSFIGRPTTNILPNPTINGRFTTSNEWGTYNTNQYNGGNFFSIGTIASVSSNIITTSGNHPFRTYDAVQPQTSGGGLTANTNYFVKKISDTQFSLHQYNSSENGSQGYIDPTTNTHKVYDSIALDQRISVNSTSFPTMWWGYPHLPNTCHVKEIVVGGGYEPGTNCMRIHVTRTAGVDGGMAYGVYTPVTAGDVIVVSFWMRSPDLRGSGATLDYTTYFNAGFDAFGSSTTITTEWKRVIYTWTASNTFNFYQYFFPAGYTTPYAVDIADLQVEINTGGIASTFTTGSRSNTEALLDMSRKTTVTASSLTYTNNNTFSFNGTSNYLTLPASVGAFGTNPFTISCWWKSNGAQTNYTSIITQGFTGSPANGAWAFKIAHTSGNLNFTYYNSGIVDNLSSTNPNDGIWHNIVAVRNGTALVLYQDTVSILSITLPANYSFGESSSVFVGYNPRDSAYLKGELPIFQIYNVAFSATEILQNFQAIRGRFGI